MLCFGHACSILFLTVPHKYHGVSVNYTVSNIVTAPLCFVKGVALICFTVCEQFQERVTDVIICKLLYLAKNQLDVHSEKLIVTSY